jgi:Leucine-rich repeat (LRR) protein
MTLKPLRNNQGSLPTQLRPVWELLQQRSIGSINEGLANFSQVAKESSATADHIFDAVGVSPRPSSRSAVAGLDAGPRFTSNDEEANPYLLYALLGLLSRAPNRSRGSVLRHAIQWLNLVCPAVPQLQGFAGLMELKLSIAKPSAGSDEPITHVLADHIAPFPCLEKLELNTDDSNSFRSLDWLSASQLKILKASNIGLESIQGLEKIHTLENIDLSHNKKLVDLAPLSSSAKSLRRPSLIACPAIEGLSAIKGLTEIDELGIDGCAAITSLESLSHLTLRKDWELNWLGLRKLAPLPLLAGDCLRLVNLHHITRLEGLERASGLKAVTIESLPALEDASALTSLKDLRRFAVSSCGNLSSLQCLGHLPTLSDVKIEKCRNLKQLPSAWPAALRSLKIGQCIITEIGQLPGEFSGELDLTECNNLLTLRGMEQCSGLTTVRVGAQAIDFSAVASLPDTWLCIDYKNVQKESARKNAKNDMLRLSNELIEALASMSKCRLKILNLNQAIPLHRIKASDLAPLTQISNLRALDISELKFSEISTEIMGFASLLIGLAELEVLRVAPRTALSRTLGSCTFDSATEIAKLKLSLLGMG